MMTPRKYDAKPPTLKVSKTLVFDSARDLQVMWLEGLVQLPPGSVIQLTQPNVEATVERVRLIASDPEATYCLDIKIPAGYWED